MEEVVIVQRRLTHYRVPLFEQMRETLSGQGISLRLLHGQPTLAECAKNDSGSLPWATSLPTHYAAGGRLMWQPFMHLARRAALVIVTQENKHLHNIPAMLRPARNQRVAFWGHGRNMQASGEGGLREAFKRWMTTRADWWFAYTQLSRQFVREAGFPDERITVLNNSVDTTTLQQQVQAARTEGRAVLRAEMGLNTGHVACFIGSLYRDKRLSFLIDACDRLHARFPNFQLVIAGAGPEQEKVMAAAAQRPHVCYVGPIFGVQKARLLAASDVMLNPGLVGLGILDAFVAGIPIITTNCGIHSPEIAYLHHGVNGLMVPDDPTAFADACAALFEDKALLSQLREGARDSAREYSIENMAKNFCEGIQLALEKQL